MKLDIEYKNKKLQISYFLRKGGNETILFLHGLGCSKDDFKNATEIESLKTYTLIALDFPGHGDSNYPIILNIDDLVEISHLFIERLNLSVLNLIGHSMGGLVGLLLAEKYPKKIKRFINVEGNLKSEDCMFSRKVSEADFESFKKVVMPELIKKLHSSSNPGFRYYAKTLEKYKPIKAYYDYSPSMVKYSDQDVLIDKFSSLKIPKLFIYGSENHQLSYIPELKKHSQTLKIKNSNHFPQADNPNEFYKEIARFILCSDKNKF